MSLKTAECLDNRLLWTLKRVSSAYMVESRQRRGSSPRCCTHQEDNLIIVKVERFVSLRTSRYINTNIDVYISFKHDIGAR